MDWIGMEGEKQCMDLTVTEAVMLQYKDLTVMEVMML